VTADDKLREWYGRWDREPAPEPSPAEQAVIARFGIFDREECMARLADDLNQHVPAALAEQQRREETHVVDRDGNVWLLPPEFDGGMATRATATGVVSAGIVWLEAEAGPLLPFNPKAYRRTYPRSEAGR
jgi:hypothetical protein